MSNLKQANKLVKKLVSKKSKSFPTVLQLLFLLNLTKFDFFTLTICDRFLKRGEEQFKEEGEMAEKIRQEEMTYRKEGKTAVKSREEGEN